MAISHWFPSTVGKNNFRLSVSISKKVWVHQKPSLPKESENQKPIRMNFGLQVLRRNTEKDKVVLIGERISIKNFHLYGHLDALPMDSTSLIQELI